MNPLTTISHEQRNLEIHHSDNHRHPDRHIDHPRSYQLYGRSLRLQHLQQLQLVAERQTPKPFLTTNCTNDTNLISSKEARSKGVLRWKKMFLAYKLYAFVGFA